VSSTKIYRFAFARGAVNKFQDCFSQ